MRRANAAKLSNVAMSASKTLGFESFWTARWTLAGVETMTMLAKRQVRAVPGDAMPAQRGFIHQLFGLVV
jgi:hypothetical protein